MSELRQQVSLTEAECSEIFRNAPPILEILKYGPVWRSQTRQEMVTSLLMNDTRNCKPKVWVLKKEQAKKNNSNIADAAERNKMRVNCVSQLQVCMCHMSITQECCVCLVWFWFCRFLF